MPWMQDHLIAAIDLLPVCLEPDDEAPNFHRLKMRMAMIERQHFVLSVQEWVEDNAQWLAHDGLRICAGRNLPHDRQHVQFYEPFEGAKAHLGGVPQRNDQVDQLINVLDLHATLLNEPFVELTVEDLNHIHWDPLRVRQVLAFKIADMVPDAYSWLGRHSAARQAKAIAAATPPASPSSPRRRF